jgi:hypothetical protein
LESEESRIWQKEAYFSAPKGNFGPFFKSVVFALAALEPPAVVGDLLERIAGRHHGRSRIVIDRDALDCVAGDVERLGDHHRDRIADMHIGLPSRFL